MIKTFFKELIIILLLLICAGLVFGIAFYNYIPISKVVPNKVSYKVPENYKEELSSDVETQTIKNKTITYSIDGTDLKQYQSTGRLTEGKQNPFSSYQETTNNVIITNGTTNTVGGGTGSGSGYYKNTGLK